MSFFKLAKDSLDDQQMIRQRQKQLQENWKISSSEHLFAVDKDLSVANKRNCENMLGAITVPLGLAGPVQINSEFFAKDKANCFVPLATSEGALVASVARGLKAINQAGGTKVFIKNQGMTRAPVFSLPDGEAALAFAKYLEQKETLSLIKKITESSSSHLEFQNLQSFVRGRNVYVRFSFLTGEAMGMNMVTIALQKLWTEHLSAYEGLEMLALSSNVCTDKKSSYINQLLGRAYGAQAEIFLSEQILSTVLKTSAESFLRTHHGKNLRGSNLAGSSAHNMQFANVVAAFYLATGQDLAHVIEASQGETIVEGEQNGLYCAVVLPNLPLGSVGGGTNLPAQREVRQLICQNETELTPTQLAAILAAGVLAAEISGLAALSSHDLAGAHQRLARGGAKQ